MELVVTSTKELKLNAVRIGFSRVFENVLCEGVSIPDQVAPQPIGFDAGREGAWGRIQYLRKQFFSHPLSSRVAVSIENFITEISPGSFFDFGCIALEDTHNHIKLETYSQCVSVPKRFVEQSKAATSESFHLRSTGYEVTAGKFIEKEMPHIGSTDFHKRFSGASREEILSTACQVLAGEYAREMIGKSIKEIPCRVYILREQDTCNNKFRLMQWNVLAQALMGDSIVKPIKDRVPLFQRELCAYDPDIICLQEVDLFYEFFSPFLSTLGYSGHFLPKTNSPCLKKPDNHGPCGCALFFKDTVFRSVKKYEFVLLNEMNMKSNQVLLVEELEYKATSQRVTVGVTHLKAMPAMHLMRLAQSKDLINKLKNIQTGKLLIAGDFNCYPTESSYQFLSEQCDIPIKSVYGEVSEPEYTCQWVGADGELNGVTVDYIWYSNDSLKVAGFYRVPEKVRSMIYASYNASDHWPLIADFLIN